MSWEDEFEAMRPEPDIDAFRDDRSDAMLDRLLDQLDDAPPQRSRRRRAPVLAAFAAIVVLVGAVALLQRSEESSPVATSPTPAEEGEPTPEPTATPDPTATATPEQVVVPVPTLFQINGDGIATYSAEFADGVTDAASEFVAALIDPLTITAVGGEPGPLTVVTVDTLDPDLTVTVRVGETGSGWVVLASGDQLPTITDGFVTVGDIPDVVRHGVLYYQVGDATVTQVVTATELQDGIETPGEGLTVVAVLYDSAGLPVDVRAAS